MKTSMRTLGTLVVAATILAACDLPPMLSDTGYRGTWERHNDRNVSLVAITEVGGRWFFRWTKRTFDGRLSILCDWDGRCVEKADGTLTATYMITTRYDAATGKLHTNTLEERVAPDNQTFRYTDVMEVVDGGLTLRNFTTDRDGAHFEESARPNRSFTKVSNSVADPPREIPR